VNFGYLAYALVALAAYSLVAPLTKLATRDLPSDVVALVTNGILVVVALAVVLRNDEPVLSALTGPTAPYLYAAGACLAVGILAYYRALALGPVSVVVPVFGLFIVTSSAVGVLLLEESFTLRKGLGIGLALVAVYLTAGE
jgi:transporter family protein